MMPQLLTTSSTITRGLRSRDPLRQGLTQIQLHPPCVAANPRSLRLLTQLSTAQCCAGSRSSKIAAAASSQQRPPRRNFSATREQLAYKTVEQARSRYRSGPFSWKAGVLFLATGAGLIVYFRQEKARMDRKRVAEATKGIGKPKVGGRFELIDHNGNVFTSEDMKGKYALVYFGFTHCPDICPEELDKMAKMIDLVKEKAGNVMRSLFVTCDPARDRPPVLKSYLDEFHPDLLGLTGDYEQIKAMCKAYRVYFSTPPNVEPGQDYLVDHSIYFYLMDPDGDFVEAIGRQDSAQQAAGVITRHISDWRGKLDKS